MTQREKERGENTFFRREGLRKGEKKAKESQWKRKKRKRKKNKEKMEADRLTD